MKKIKISIDGQDAEFLFDLAVNKPEAARYFKMAADKGHIKAMHNYAIGLYFDDGTAINKPEAIRYFKMAADK